MKIKNVKTLWVNILICLLVVVLYVGCAVFMNAPPVEATEPVSAPPTVEKSVSVEEPLPPEEQTVHPKAEAERDEQPPRTTYSLALPTVQRSEEMKNVTLKKTEQQPQSYFDGALFIGDSVTLGLQNYTVAARKTDPAFMGNARFLAIGSYGVYEATKSVDDADSIHKIIGGKKRAPAYFAEQFEVTKIFICLGLNDVGLFSKEEYLSYYSKLIGSLREVLPDAQIILQSITPLTLYGERKVLYNAKIDEYNEALARFSASHGCVFADIALAMKDSAGYLACEYSSDDYCHLMPAAYDLWINWLLTHAVE